MAQFTLVTCLLGTDENMSKWCRLGDLSSVPYAGEPMADRKEELDRNLDPNIRERLAALGTSFKTARLQRGWSERQAVRIVGHGFTRAQLNRIESGEPVRSAAYQHYARALGKRFELTNETYAEKAYPVCDYRELAGPILSFTVTQGGGMDRRQLIASLTALLLDGALPQVVKALFANPACPFRTPSEVDELAAACSTYLAKHKAFAGAGGAYGAAIAMHSQACTWRDALGLGPGVARALEVLCCDLGAWAGYAALDANKPQAAEQILRETLSRTRLLGASDIETRVIDSWAVHCSRQDRPEEALSALSIGLQIAPSAKARALMHLRAAEYSARSGDAQSFASHVGAARDQLGKESRNHASWLEFLTTGAYYVGRGHLDLGQVASAIRAFDEVATDPESYPSDITHAKILTARALAEAGDLTQASSVGLEVMPMVRTLESVFALDDFRRLTRTIRDGEQPPLARTFLSAVAEWPAD